MSKAIQPVVLAGGSGTRLWPLSRRLLPKQFLPLVSERSLLQDTILRASALPNCVAPIVITNHEHRFLVAEQLTEIGVASSTIILEPSGRNTAPAIAIAALHARQVLSNAVLLVMPSDQMVRGDADFQRTVSAAVDAASAGALVTFGIRPTHPATGFGYIEIGEPIDEPQKTYKVRRFVEKPSQDKAAQFLSDGRFLWNSGNFVFTPEKYLSELADHRPDIARAASAAYKASALDMGFLKLGEELFNKCPSQSVDYAVMEQTRSGAVVAADFVWSDVGSWSALWDIADKDAEGNAVRGDVRLDQTSRCLVRAEHRLVSIIGADNLVVVETDDAVLIAAKDKVQDVKEVVEHLELQKRTEHVSHSRVYRPWGYYETVDKGTGYQVKRIMVKPGRALSLQYHHQRAEHWIVVSGTAKVTRGSESMTLSRNQSTYIPTGVKHRLENAALEPLFLIEVQSGDYLGEDDIVRLEDRYNRT